MEHTRILYEYSYEYSISWVQSCTLPLRAHGRRHPLVARLMARFVAFPPLKTAGYRPTTFDYDPPAADVAADGAKRPGKEEWVEVFRKSIPEFKRRAAADPRVEDAEALAEKFAEEYDAHLVAVLAGDHAGLFDGAPTVLKLCKLRDDLLRRLGFADCFLSVKSTENEQALTVLPGVLAELDALTDPAERLLALVKGVFAGNIFDLGAATSAALYADGGGDFIATRAELKPQPWCVDDFEALKARWLGGGGGGGYKKCVMFVDNSGADVLLGMLPLARELVRGGCEVILAANEVPSINDITAQELTPLLTRVASFDPVVADAIAAGRLRVCSSGSDLPVIDLSCISPGLAEAAEGVDLVVLEGMGRAIETNLYARFACDSLKLGMVKHPEVATCLGGTLYDCVCKFDTGDGGQ